MARAVRQPPGETGKNNPRDLEAFFNELHDQHKLVGSRTFDLPSIASGAQSSFTITVNGAKAGVGQTVEYGLPSTWNTGLRIDSVFVSADNTVTVVVGNPTGGAINMGSATYYVRVRP